MRILAFLLTLAPLAPSQTFTAAQRQADLDFVRTELPRRHPNFFAVTPRADFDRAATTLGDALSTLPDEQFYTRLIALVALGRDAHTSLYANHPAIFPLLPTLFRWFDDGVFVTAASDDSLHAARVLAINGIAIDVVLERIRAVVAYENENWYRYAAQGVLGNLGILRGLGIVPPNASASFTFRLASGETVTRELGVRTAALTRPIAQTPGFTPATLRRLDENYWAEYWPATRTIYLAYRVCAEIPSKPIPQFANEIVSLFAQGPVDNTVIDLRGNTGGNSRYFEQLIFALQTPLGSLRDQPGFRAYALIDRGTFSSGMLAAVFLRQNFSGIVPLYGEATGGSPLGYGEVVPFRLPGSGLAGQHSTRLFNALNGLTTVEPAVAIGLRSTDYFARHDSLLAHVFARSVPAYAESSGDLITLNAASLRPDATLSPGALATTFGSFATPPDAVRVNGRAADLIGATTRQVSFVVPPAIEPGVVTVEIAGQQGRARLHWVSPALFSAEPGSPFQAAAHTRDGNTIRLYATGLAAGLSVEAWIAERPANVLRADPAPGIAGLWIVETQLPENVSGFVPVFLATGGLASNAVTLSVP